MLLLVGSFEIQIALTFITNIKSKKALRSIYVFPTDQVIDFRS